MQAISAVEFHQTLTEAVKASSQELRNHASMPIGKAARQGDVYIHRIKKTPAAWNVQVSEHHQVALGASIGSRHVASGNVRVFWPQSVESALSECPIKGLVKKLGNGARFCLGPVVTADASWTLTHPEHAHHEFPAGSYLVTYQLDFARQRQVID